MANVQIYSLRRDGEKNVAKNFKIKEFRCKDGTDTIKICQETVDILQRIRDYFGKPVIINSAYRTPSHNKAVGGVSSSQHVVGTACDIKISGIPSSAIAGFLEANYPIHGIGLYPTFVHIDSRGRKSYWKNNGSNVSVSSFKKGASYQSYKAKVIENNNAAVAIEQPQVKEEENMTDQEIYEAMMRHAKVLSMPDWAVDEFNEAIDLGITDGSDPMAMIPRYQAAIMAKRALEKNEK